MVERAVRGLQNNFLKEVRASQRSVAVFLVNSIRLHGRVEFFDTHIVAVKSTVMQLVYKHAFKPLRPCVMKVLSRSQKNGPERSSMSLYA
jgi:host factor-I protein